MDADNGPGDQSKQEAYGIIEAKIVKAVEKGQELHDYYFGMVKDGKEEESEEKQETTQNGVIAAPDLPMNKTNFAEEISQKPQPEPQETKPRMPSLAELEAENRRLRALLAEATRPIESSSPVQSRVVDLNQITEMEGAEMSPKEEGDAEEVEESGRMSSGSKTKSSEGAKKKRKGAGGGGEGGRPRSRERSAERAREKKLEKKKQNHITKVREAQWTGRMEGRLGNLKPTPVAEKQSLRLRQPRENTAREPNPAMDPLPITPKQQELHTAMVTGVRPFLPGAMMMEEELGQIRAESPLATRSSRSPSPSALERALSEDTGDSNNKQPHGGGSRPNSTGGGRKRRGQSPGASRRPNNNRERDSQSPLMTVSSSLPAIATSTKGGADTIAAGVLAGGSSAVSGSHPHPHTQTQGQREGVRREKGGAAITQPYRPAAVAPGATELFPVSSHLLRGLRGTVGHKPMVLSLLASKRALWKATAAQQFDPHLHLAAYPPPPDKIVVNLYDVSTVSLTAGDKYCPQQASFVVNVREYTALLYDLVDRYKQREEVELREGMEARSSITEKVRVPSYAAAVPRAFCPSSLEWWSTHLPSVVVVRAKGNGNLMVRISKGAIEKLVHYRICNYLDLPLGPDAEWRPSAVPVDPTALIEKWWDQRLLLGPENSSSFGLQMGRSVSASSMSSMSPPKLRAPSSSSSSSSSEEKGRDKDKPSGAKTVPQPQSQAQAQAQTQAQPRGIDVTSLALSQTSYTVGMFAPQPSPGAGVGAGVGVQAREVEMDGSASGSILIEEGGEEPSQQQTRAGTDKEKEKKKSSRRASPRQKRRGSPEKEKEAPLYRDRPLAIPDTYKPLPGRSKAPGFFGNEAQGSGAGSVSGYAWNDNVDVDRRVLQQGQEGHFSSDNDANHPVLFVGDSSMGDIDATSHGNRDKGKSLSPSSSVGMLGTDNNTEDREEKDDPPQTQEQGQGQEGYISPKKKYGIKTAEECARETIIRAREVVSTKSSFRNRKLTNVEAGLFRSPFAEPLVTVKMKIEAEKLEL